MINYLLVTNHQKIDVKIISGLEINDDVTC